MLFHSIEFAIFLPIVFILYWIVFSKNAGSQNLLLLIASLIFYGWTDWRFLSIILFNALFNFFIGISIADAIKENTKKLFFWLGIVTNIGVLCYFKYFNFFLESFAGSSQNIRTDISYDPLQILLPLGISFFTFQTVGYLIDIFKEEIKPNRDILVFTTYVTFFPKVLAGPIERAQRFIPQIEVGRLFDYTLATDGLRQILWGLFKKIVIADNCGTFVNMIFNSTPNPSGSTLLLGIFFFMFQLYCDFSGYSDIATGVSKLFGIRLMRNSAFPYFATSMSGFWSKWHISLTSWMMEYVFTPLSFLLRRYKKTGLIISIMITFLIVGLWHGGTLVFMILGLLSGIFYIPAILKGAINNSSIVAKGKFLPSIKEFFQMMRTFFLLMLAAVFILSDSIWQASDIFRNIFSMSLFTLPEIRSTTLILFIFFLLYIEWLGRGEHYAIARLGFKYPRIVRWGFYSLLMFLMGMFMETGGTPFIYFQF